MVEILSSFLNGRSLTIRVEQAFSQPAPFTAGVPQGSVLGTNLFLECFTGFPPKLPVSPPMKANGVDLHRTNRELLQSAIDDVRKWFDDGDLPINDNNCAIWSFAA